LESLSTIGLVYSAGWPNGGRRTPESLATTPKSLRIQYFG